MIDIESEIFDMISKKLREDNRKIFVTGENVKSPSSFPCVSIVEVDNQVYRNTRTTSAIENHAQLLYEVNVYSNKTNGKKSEAKKILSLVDTEFSNLGFTRVMTSPIPNERDSTIYRIVARYRAIVSKDKTIYRR